MSREKSEGFSYCSQDTDTFFDPKIRMLIATHGCDGYAVWDYIKLAAYREKGYYVEWDDCRAELASADLGIEPTKIGLIVNYLLRRSLLSCMERKTCTSRSGVKVLTSHGIQKRFQRMARDCKRSYCVDAEIWLLREDETLSCIKVDQKTDSSGNKDDHSGKKSDHSGIKSTKSNQIKEKKRKESSSAPARGNDEEDDADDDRRENEILRICAAAVGSLDTAEKQMILSACAGQSMDAVQKAVEVARSYGAHTAKYLAQTIETQREKPCRSARAGPAAARGTCVLGNGLRPAPRIEKNEDERR